MDPSDEKILPTDYKKIKTQYATIEFETLSEFSTIRNEILTELTNFFKDQNFVIVSEFQWICRENDRDLQLENELRNFLNRQMISQKWALKDRFEIREVPKSVTFEQIRPLGEKKLSGIYRQQTPKLLQFTHSITAQVHAKVWDFDPNEFQWWKNLAEKSTGMNTMRVSLISLRTS